MTSKRGGSGEQESDHVLVSRNPATLNIVDEFRETTPAEVDEAVTEARAAQPEWAERTPDERLDVLDRLRELVLERTDEVVATISQETGRPPAGALAGDVSILLNMLAYLTSHGPEILEEPINLGLAAVGESKVVREPLGVVGVISPWNVPMGIPSKQVIPPLFAGNAVVLKPAEETPVTAFLLRDLLREAGLPEDVLRVVPGRGSTTGQALVETNVDYVFFTGSTEAGAEVEQTCSARGIPTCLELGGSDPAVVLSDADLDLSVDGIVWARFAAAGQACCSVKRLYVHRSLYPEFRDRVLERVEELEVGYDGYNEVGPLIRAEAVENIHDQVERSVEMGAEVLLGGEPVEHLDGHFYEPTVIVNVTQEMPVMTEETFGPVLPLAPFEDVDEAVELSNDTDYGLTASVWTQDTDRGERVARRIKAGTVTVNEHLYTYFLHATPWGGYGASGGDFANGRWGLEAVTRTQHVHVAAGESSLRNGRVKDLWWFPYDEDVLEDSMQLLYGHNVGSRLRAIPSVLRVTIRNR